ncbi:MAG: hypothetical protein HYV97_11920 [Bdellovibrio sp.]|nr:hypothetical protein [Bdellovibrio sp.]
MVNTTLRGFCIVAFLLFFFGCESKTGKSEVKNICPVGYRCQQLKIEEARRADLQPAQAKIIVRTFIKIHLPTIPNNEKIENQKFFLTSDGASIAFDQEGINLQNTTFQNKLALNAELLRAEKINILLSAPQPTSALVSLTRSNNGQEETLGTGMVQLNGLLGDGIIHLNDATSFVMRLAMEKLPTQDELHCIIEPYHRLLDFFQRKLGNTFFNMSLAELNDIRKNDAEVNSHINQILTACHCPPLPKEHRRQFSNITLSLNLKNLQSSHDKNFTVRIKREDGAYLPIKNNGASNLEFAFKVPQVDKDFLIKFETLNLAGPPLGTIEIINNENIVLNTLVNLQNAFSGETVILNSSAALVREQSELPRTVKFAISPKGAKAVDHYLLQRHDQLFIPLSVDSQTGEIEFHAQSGHGWAKIMSINNQKVQHEALINLEGVVSRNQGVSVSLLGNTVMGLLTEFQPLSNFEGECLHHHYNELMRNLSRQNQGHETDASLRIDREMQNHLNRLKQDKVCRKRPRQK